MKWRVKILSRMSRALTFLCEFLRRPTQIGAVAPSSQALAREMVEQAKVREAEVIVEFGAGTGVMTKEIERCRSANSHFFSIEQNPTLVEILRQELPQVDLCCQSAADFQDTQEDHIWPVHYHERIPSWPRSPSARNHWP